MPWRSNSLRPRTSSDLRRIRIPVVVFVVLPDLATRVLAVVHAVIVAVVAVVLAVVEAIVAVVLAVVRSDRFDLPGGRWGGYSARLATHPARGGDLPGWGASVIPCSVDCCCQNSLDCPERSLQIPRATKHRCDASSHPSRARLAKCSRAPRLRGLHLRGRGRRRRRSPTTKSPTARPPTRFVEAVCATSVAPLARLGVLDSLEPR